VSEKKTAFCAAGHLCQTGYSIFTVGWSLYNKNETKAREEAKTVRMDPQTSLFNAIVQTVYGKCECEHYDS